jgi:hypothetical protein
MGAERDDYRIVETASGCAIQRQDGALAEFLGSDEAAEALENLRSGGASEKDYYWYAA